MIPGSKRKMFTELKASVALLDEDIETLGKAIREQVDQQKETNRLLSELVSANKNFVNVIENFFAIEKKLHLEESRRREKRELDRLPTDADNKY